MIPSPDLFHPTVSVDEYYLPAWPDHVNPIEHWYLTFAGKTFQNGSLFFEPKDL
jgi:hypothetical protein